MKVENDGLYISLHFIPPYRVKYIMKHLISDTHSSGIKSSKLQLQFVILKFFVFLPLQVKAAQASLLT